MTTSLSLQPFAEIVVESPRRVDGKYRSAANSPFLGLASHVRQFVPEHDPHDMLRAFNAAACEKLIVYRPRFSKWRLFYKLRRHVLSPLVSQVDFTNVGLLRRIFFLVLA